MAWYESIGPLYTCMKILPYKTHKWIKYDDHNYFINVEIYKLIIVLKLKRWEYPFLCDETLNVEDCIGFHLSYCFADKLGTIKYPETGLDSDIKRNLQGYSNIEELQNYALKLGIDHIIRNKIYENHPQI